MKSSGEFYDTRPNTITINPNRCDKTGEFSFFLICAHEWAHLLDKKCKIFRPFKKEFIKQGKNLYLTNYSKNDDSEQLAEIIVLYLTNPYLLKVISMEHYHFLKRFFNSPTTDTKGYFLTQYEKYSPRYQHSLTKKYGITIKGMHIYKNGIEI